MLYLREDCKIFNDFILKSLHLLALVVLALLMRNNNLIEQRNRHEDFQQNNFLPTPLSKIKADEDPYYLPTTQDGRPIYSCKK